MSRAARWSPRGPAPAWCGGLPIQIPRDRAGTFEPQLIGKQQTSLSGFDDKIPEKNDSLFMAKYLVLFVCAGNNCRSSTAISTRFQTAANTERPCSRYLQISLQS